MTKTTRNDRSSEPSCRLLPSMPEAFDDLRMSVDRFCLLAGLESLNEMMSADAEALCGSRHARSGERKGHRWGTTRSEIAYHGGKVKVERPRVRDFAGREMSLPSWELLSEPELLQAWAMNLMVINVSTRKYARAVRLPDDAGGDLPAASGDATSKSAVSRRFVALTRSKLKAWLASPLDDLDLVVLQIDGLHVGDHLMVAAIGIDTGGAKHVLGLAEGATENAATVQAMLDNLIERGLDPERPRLYIVDGAKALSKAIRRTFGRAAALQRCQVHKGRNITDRLDESLHAGVRKVLRQAWQQDDAAKAGTALAQPRPPSGAWRTRRLGLDPGGPGRDPDGDPARPPAATSTLAGLHQRHRERDRHRPDGAAERQALAQRRDGAALDRRRPLGGAKDLPPPQGLPPAPRP